MSERDLLIGLRRSDSIVWHTHAQKKPKSYSYPVGLDRSIMVGEVINKIHDNISPKRQKRIQTLHKRDQGK